jgi:hypothetical protein
MWSFLLLAAAGCGGLTAVKKLQHRPTRQVVDSAPLQQTRQ